MARGLGTRPLLREAVRRGEVSLRKAEIVLEASVAEDERYWTWRARIDTARRLEQAVRHGAPCQDEGFLRVRYTLPPEGALTVETALEMASFVLESPDGSLERRLEALAFEFLGGHPLRAPEDEPPRADVSGRVAAGRADLERAVSVPAPPICAAAVRGDGAGHAATPGAGREPTPLLDWLADRRPASVLAVLKRIVAARADEDEHLGRACLLIRTFACWRPFADDFDGFLVEHLGLAPTTVRQRIALELAMRALPALRVALRSGRLSYEQARAVAKVATPEDVGDRIAAAAGKSCIALQREVEQEERRQMWKVGELRADLSRGVEGLLARAMRSARSRAACLLTPGEALLFIAVHLIETWRPEVERRVRAMHPVMRRDRGLCQVPGCSHVAEHVHHVQFRSAGGGDVEWNLVSICAAHHLKGIHEGRIRVSGRAPGGLVWIFPTRWTSTEGAA